MAVRTIASEPVHWWRYCLYLADPWEMSCCCVFVRASESLVDCEPYILQSVLALEQRLHFLDVAMPAGIALLAMPIDIFCSMVALMSGLATPASYIPCLVAKSCTLMHSDQTLCQRFDHCQQIISGQFRT